MSRPRAVRFRETPRVQLGTLNILLIIYLCLEEKNKGLRSRERFWKSRRFCCWMKQLLLWIQLRKKLCRKLWILWWRIGRRLLLHISKCIVLNVLVWVRLRIVMLYLWWKKEGLWSRGNMRNCWSWKENITCCINRTNIKLLLYEDINIMIIKQIFYIYYTTIKCIY